MAVPLPKPPKPVTGISDRGEALKGLLSGSYGAKKSSNPINFPRTDILSAAATLPRTDPDSIDWDPFWRPLEQTLLTVTAGGMGVVNAIDKGVAYATSTDPSKHMNYLSHLGPIGDFNRGFLASITVDKNSDDFVYGSDLIENISDNVGKRYDPSYVDRENNIDPRLKFGAGLAIDIFTDPITYLPGGIIASGVRGGVRAAQAAKGLGKIPAGIKGVKTGLPQGVGDYKMGRFTKQLKPTGYDEWVASRSLNKLEKVARKNQIPIEGLLAVGSAKSAKSYEIAAAKFTRESPIGRKFTVDDVKALQKEVQNVRAGNIFYPIKGSAEAAETLLSGVAKSPAAQAAARAAATKVGVGAARYTTLKAGEAADEARYQAMREEAVRRTKAGFWAEARQEFKAEQAAAEAAAKAEEAAKVRMPSSADPEYFDDVINNAAEQALRRFQPTEDGVSPNQSAFTIIDEITDSPVGSTEGIARVVRERIRNGEELDLNVTAPSGKQYSVSELMDAIIDGTQSTVSTADLNYVSRLLPRALENMQEARKSAMRTTEPEAPAKPVDGEAPAEDIVIDPMGVPRPVGTLKDIFDYAQIDAYADELEALARTEQALDAEIMATLKNTSVEGFVYDVNTKGLKKGELETALERAGITTVIDSRKNPNDMKLDYVHLKGDRLEVSLGKKNIKYVPAGAQLGDKPGNAALYVDGLPSYETIRNIPEWQAGVDQIVAQVKQGETIAILTFGETTRDTLTTRLLRPELNARGFQVKYVQVGKNLDLRPEGWQPNAERLRALYEKRAAVKVERERILQQTIKADARKLLPGATESEINRVNRRLVSAEAHSMAGWRQHIKSPLRGLQQIDVGRWVDNVENIVEESAKRLHESGVGSVEAQSVLLTKLLALHGGENVQAFLDRLVFVGGGTEKASADLTDIGDAAMFIEKILGSSKPFGALADNRFEPGIGDQEIFEAVQTLASLKAEIPGYTDKARKIMGVAGARPGDIVEVRRSYDFIRTYKDAVENNPGERVNIWGKVVNEDFVAEEANRAIDSIGNTYIAEAARVPDIPTGRSAGEMLETSRARVRDISANDEGINVIRDTDYLRKNRIPVKKQKVTKPQLNPVQSGLQAADYAIVNSRLKPSAQPGFERPSAGTVADRAALQKGRPPAGSLAGKKIFVTFDEASGDPETLLEFVGRVENTWFKGKPELLIPELPTNLALVNSLRGKRIPFTVVRGEGGFGRTSSETTLNQLGDPPGGSLKDHTIMLARNGELAGQPLTNETKNKILTAHRSGATFNVGDMPGVDSAFTDYLNEIGARYTVYYMGDAPRMDVTGSKKTQFIEGDPQAGKGTSKGDAKDVEMRRSSDSAIVELDSGAGARPTTAPERFQFFDYAKFDKETRPVVPRFNPTNQKELVDVYDHIVGFARRPIPGIENYVQVLYRIAGNSDPVFTAKDQARALLQSIDIPYQAGSRGELPFDVMRAATHNPKAQKAYLQYVEAFKQLDEIDPTTGKKIYFEARGAGLDIFGQLWRNRHDPTKTRKGAEKAFADVENVENLMHPYQQLPDGDVIWQAVKEARTPVSMEGKPGAEFVMSATGRKMWEKELPDMLDVLTKYLGRTRAHEVLPFVRHQEAQRKLQRINTIHSGAYNNQYKFLEERDLLGDSVHRQTIYSHIDEPIRKEALTHAAADAITDLNRAYMNGPVENIADYWGATVNKTDFEYRAVLKEALPDELIQRAEKVLSNPNTIKMLFNERVGSEIIDPRTVQRATGEAVELDFMRDPEAAAKLGASDEYAVINRIGEEGGALVRWTMADDPRMASFINDIALLVRIDEEVAMRLVPEALTAALDAGASPGVFDANVFVRNFLNGLKSETRTVRRNLTREETALYNEGKLVGDVTKVAKNRVEQELDLKRLLPADPERTGLLGTAWRQYDEKFVDIVSHNLLGRRFRDGQAIAEFLRSKNLTLRGMWDSQREAFVAEGQLINDAVVHNADDVRRLLSSPDAAARIDEMLTQNANRVQSRLLNVKNVSARNLIQNAAADAYKRSVAGLTKGEQYAKRDNVWKNLLGTVSTKFTKGTVPHWNASMLALARWHDLALSTGVFPVTKLVKKGSPRYVTVSAQQDWAYLSFMDVYRTITAREPGMDEFFRTALDAGFPINVIEEAAVLAMKMNRAEAELFSETKTMILSEYMIQRLKIVDSALGESITPLRGDNFNTAFVAKMANWLTDSAVAGELLQKHTMYAAAAFRTADEASNAIVEPVREAVVRVANDIQRSSKAQHDALNESIDNLRAVLRQRGYGKDSLESLLSFQKLSKFHVEHFTPLDLNAARYAQRLETAAVAGTGDVTSAKRKAATTRQQKIAAMYEQGKQVPQNIRQAQRAWLEEVRAAQNAERAALAADTTDLAKQITAEDVTSMGAAGVAAGDEGLIAAGFEKAINIAEHVESLTESLQRTFTQGPVMNGYLDMTAQMAARGTKGNYAEHIAANEARRAAGLPTESLEDAIRATPETERLPGASFERTSRTTRFMTAMSGRANMRFAKHIQVTEEAGMDAVRNMFERPVEATLKEAQQLFGNDKEAVDFGWAVIMGTFGPRAGRKPLEQIATTPEQMAIAEKIVHQTRTLFDTEYSHTLAMTGLDTDHINSWLRRGPLTTNAAQLPEGMTGYDIRSSIPVMLENVYDAYLNGVRGADYTTLLKGYNFALRNAAIAPNSAARLSAQFGHRGLGYSSVKEALADGLVQPKVGRGAGTLFQWLDPTQAYPKEILEQARQLEKFMDYDTQNVGKLLKAFDKPTTVIKSSLTLWKLGHHVVSSMGEAFMNVLAGVYNPYRYAQAWRTLREGGEFKSGSIFGENILDIENWAKGYADEAVPNPSRKVMEQTGNRGIPIRIGNKTTVVPYGAFYREFMRRGLGISANVAEDLLVQSDQIVKSGGAIKKLFGPILRANQGLAEFSARRDNLFRLAHAIDITQKRSFSSSDDMFESLGIEVTQWHPTMQSLSGFERKYMRRLVFFYTWMRNATNKIVEAIVENPMAFTLAPRVNYAISGAMGGDPQSVGQPAPNDPRIADFYARQVLGPAWYDADGNVVGISINAPQLDIMQSLIGGIQYDTNLPFYKQVPGSTATFLRENVVGTLNPIMKGIGELTYGTEMRPYGAVPIEDVGEYITDLTGLGYISRGTGVAFINEQGFLQPRTDRDDNRISQIEKQNRSNINALTGLRFAEYNKYFETAERQRKERNRSYLEEFMKNFGNND